MISVWTVLREVLRLVIVIGLLTAYLGAVETWGFLDGGLIIVPLALALFTDALERRTTKVATNTYDILQELVSLIKYMGRPKNLLWILFGSALVATCVPPAWEFTKRNTSTVTAALTALYAFLTLCLVFLTFIGIMFTREHRAEVSDKAVPSGAPAASSDAFDILVIFRELAKLRRRRT